MDCGACSDYSAERKGGSGMNARSLVMLIKKGVISVLRGVVKVAA
jgi:hypothetical protein